MGKPFSVPVEPVHQDVEFLWSSTDAGSSRVFDNFAHAAAWGVMMAAANGEKFRIDVLVWSEESARALAGDYGVEQYLEDLRADRRGRGDASVFERLEISVHNVGRVP